ncbi:hypothetical protein [Ensifer sp. B1-9]|uniref:hypothetical protein n=1 Tax=Ensifer sp. B1-9 TaxID=3141455 RepID=UPI003D1BEAB4
MDAFLTTCGFSEPIKLRPNPTVLRFLRQNTVWITFPVCMDINRGISQLKDRKPQKAQRLADWWAATLQTYPYCDGMSPAAAEIYAAMQVCRGLRDLWAAPIQARNPRWGGNLMIAAISLAENKPVATVCAKRFLQIREHFPQLRVYGIADGCWLEPKPPTTRSARSAWPSFPTRSPAFPALRLDGQKRTGGEARP